jgi:hypothetical protein
MKYTKEDQLLKTYLELMYGKHAARVWIKYPKHELFKILSKFHDKKWFSIMQKAVVNDQDYVLKLLFNVDKSFIIDYSTRIEFLKKAFTGLN